MRRCNTGLRCWPQSRLDGASCFLMCIPPTVLLRVQFVSTCFTVAASRSTLCCVFHACTAIPFFVSFLFTARLCSLTIFPNILPVSPMYTHSHSAQGICYTTSLFFHTGSGSFVCTSASWSVLLDLKIVLISSGLHTCSILSLTALT